MTWATFVAETSHITQYLTQYGDLQGCFEGDAIWQAECCNESLKQHTSCFDLVHRPGRCCGQRIKSTALNADHQTHQPEKSPAPKIVSLSQMSPDSQSVTGQNLLQCVAIMSSQRVRRQESASPSWIKCEELMTTYISGMDLDSKQGFNEAVTTAHSLKVFCVEHGLWGHLYFPAMIAIQAAVSSVCSDESMKAWRKYHMGYVERGSRFCVESLGADVLHQLKMAKRFKLAKSILNKLVINRKVRWTSLQETPPVYIPELESQRWWTSNAHVQLACKTLEEVQPLASSELEMLLASQLFPRNDAYEEFKQNFTWSSAIFYDCYNGWDNDGCRLFPRTCNMLRVREHQRQLFLRKPTLCFTDHHERVGVFRTSPGTVVPLHGTFSGSINVHIGLRGLSGATLVVGGASKNWSTTEAFAFQDSFDHTVYHFGPDPRFILMMSVSHPRWEDTVHSWRTKRRATETTEEGRRWVAELILI